MSNVLLDLRQIQKYYQPGKYILNRHSFLLREGESAALMGTSGKGKTTLLNLIGLLDKRFEGEYYLSGKNIKLYDLKQLAVLRNKVFGFIFQNFLFVNHLCVRDNIALPLLYQGVALNLARSKAERLLESFGMVELSARYPRSLSGGQQQRVTIMRAMIHEPKCLLLDEPTSQLDETSQQQILSLLMSYQNQKGCSLVMVTHHKQVAALCQHQWII